MFFSQLDTQKFKLKIKMFSPNQTGILFDRQLLQKKFTFFTSDLDTDYIRNFT